MLAAAQMTFLASLAGAVLWLAYLARHQDAAGEPMESRPQSPRAGREREGLRAGRP